MSRARYRPIDVELAKVVGILRFTANNTLFGWDREQERECCLCPECRVGNRRKTLYWHLERYYRGFNREITRIEDPEVRAEALKIICLRTLNGKKTNR